MQNKVRCCVNLSRKAFKKLRELQKYLDSKGYQYSYGEIFELYILGEMPNVKRRN